MYNLRRLIQHELHACRTKLKLRLSGYRDSRVGDVYYSLADISKARCLLGYQHRHTLAQRLKTAMDWYLENLTTLRQQD